MVQKILLFAYRKAGISPEEFKTHYEGHVELLKSLAGDAFPSSHRRTYLARTAVDTAAEDASTVNANTPAAVIKGKQSEFDYDVIAEVTFADADAFKAFERVLYPQYAPETAAKIAANEEKFMDLSKMSIVRVGDSLETV